MTDETTLHDDRTAGPGWLPAWFAHPTHLELPEALRAWVAREWPFTRPRYVGVDLGWDEWAQLRARS